MTVVHVVLSLLLKFQCSCTPALFLHFPFIAGTQCKSSLPILLHLMCPLLAESKGKSRGGGGTKGKSGNTTSSDAKEQGSPRPAGIGSCDSPCQEASDDSSQQQGTKQTGNQS